MEAVAVALVGTDFAVPDDVSPAHLADALDDSLTGGGVVHYERPADALAADAGPFDCLLNGVAFDAGALSFLTDLRDRHGGLPVVHLAASPDEGVPARAFEGGVADCLCLSTHEDAAATLTARVRDVIDDEQSAPFASGTGLGSEFPVGTAGQFHYRDLVEYMPDPVFVLGTDGTIKFVNDAIESLTGYAQAGLVGRDASVLVGDPETEDRPNPGLLDADRATGTVEVTLRTADGESIPTETHLAILPPDDGVPFRGTIAVVRDITERTEARDQLRQAEQRLQVLNRVLRHNLRNELGVMIAAADALAEELRTEHDTPESATMAADVAEAGRDLLDISEEVRRIQSALEHEPVEVAAIDAVAVVTDVIESARAEFPDARIGLDLPAQAPVTAGEALSVAIEHLVENAIIHDDGDGTVEITVREHETDRDDWYEIRVADDGPGIPEQEQVVVDEDAEITPLKHGSGLGLWAVAWIVESFDGTVDIEADDDGSVVAIRVPSAE